MYCGAAGPPDNRTATEPSSSILCGDSVGRNGSKRRAQIPKKITLPHSWHGWVIWHPLHSATSFKLSSTSSSHTSTRQQVDLLWIQDFNGFQTSHGNGRSKGAHSNCFAPIYGLLSCWVFLQTIRCLAQTTKVERDSKNH